MLGGKLILMLIVLGRNVEKLQITLRLNMAIPRCSMYGIFTYIWAMFRVNVGKYSIHGASGIDNSS